jgi:hypothetical protein
VQLAATSTVIDAPGATGEQDVGKAAGRGAVEANTPGRIEEVVERGRKLPPPRDTQVRGLRARSVASLATSWAASDDDLSAVAAGGDGGLRPGAALERTALDEQAIDANTGGHECAVDA